MRKTLIAAAALALLLGCAQKQWHHNAKSQQDFYRDNSQCMAMAGSGQSQQIAANSNPVLQGYNQGAAMAAAGNQRAIHEQCMYGNGWQLR